jgi:hypothetical protein
MRTTVFFDFEASDLDGFPIEIGWAFWDDGALLSESHLIAPPSQWPVKGAAEKLHGISLTELKAVGRPVAEIARRMNDQLMGQALYADDWRDARWLAQLFEAAEVQAAFSVESANAKDLIADLARERGLSNAHLVRAQELASARELQRHRVEPDARRLALTWHIVGQYRRE